MSTGSLHLRLSPDDEGHETTASNTTFMARCLKQVELWFAKIEPDVIARGIFTSVTES